MKELVFKGKFETNKSKEFLDKVTKAMESTDTLFGGSVLEFDVVDFEEYEDVTSTDKTNNDENQT